MPYVAVNACSSEVLLEQEVLNRVRALPDWTDEELAAGQLEAPWRCLLVDGHSGLHVAFLADLEPSYWFDWATGHVQLVAAEPCPADVGEPGVDFDPDQDSLPCHLPEHHDGPHWGPAPPADDWRWWQPA